MVDMVDMVGMIDSVVSMIVMVCAVSLSVGLAHHLCELLLGQLAVPVPVVPLEHGVNLGSNNLQHLVYKHSFYCIYLYYTHTYSTVELLTLLVTVLLCTMVDSEGASCMHPIPHTSLCSICAFADFTCLQAPCRFYFAKD